VLGGVPEIFGMAANALSGASNTAKSERAMAKAGARTRRALVFLIAMGMQIPSETYFFMQRRPATQLAPAHRKNSVPPDSILGRPSHA
jgi:hypothetical protein